MVTVFRINIRGSKVTTGLQVMVMEKKSMVTVWKRYRWTLQSGGYGGSDSPLGLRGGGGGGWYKVE